MENSDIYVFFVIEKHCKINNILLARDLLYYILLYFIDKQKRKIYNSVEYGLVAQLGECYIRIVEVVGSTPIGSTRKRFTPSGADLLFFR